MTSPLRYGLIGTGMMGLEHIRNLDALEGAELVAICDSNPGSLNAAHQAAGNGVALFENHHALLAEASCDAIVIATPNMTHAEVLLDIVEAGIPTLVEKPLCTTIGDCQRVIAAAEPDALVWVGLEYRYMPAIAGLIETVGAGKVGPVRMIAIREHRFPFLRKVDDWNRFNVNTGGTLVEKCCHFFDLMNLIVGEKPLRVFASGGQDLNHLDEVYEAGRPDILDNAFVIVEFPSGVRGMLDLCMFAEATRNQQEISVVGELGKVEALIPESRVRTGIRGRHRIGKVDEITTSNPEIRQQGYHHGASYVEHLRFRDAILNRSRPEVGLEEGLWSVAVGVAAHRSIAEGRPITLDEVLNHPHETRNHE